MIVKETVKILFRALKFKVVGVSAG